MTDEEYKQWFDSWVNTKYKCIETGEVLELTPEMVKERAFYGFGKCFIDLGRVGSYCRFGGSFEVLS